MMFLVQLDLFMLERRRDVFLLTRAVAVSGVCLKFKIVLKFCVLQLFFQSGGDSLSFAHFFTALMNE